MYKGTHENRQRRTDAIPMGELAAGIEAETPLDRLRSLVAADKRLAVRIRDVKANQLGKELLKELGQQKLDLQNQIIVAKAAVAAIRPCFPNWPEFLLIAMREQCTKIQMRLLCARARELAAETGQTDALETALADPDNDARPPRWKDSAA